MFKQQDSLTLASLNQAIQQIHSDKTSPKPWARLIEDLVKHAWCFKKEHLVHDYINQANWPDAGLQAKAIKAYLSGMSTLLQKAKEMESQQRQAQIKEQERLLEQKMAELKIMEARSQALHAKITSDQREFDQLFLAAQQNHDALFDAHHQVTQAGAALETALKKETKITGGRPRP